MQQDPLGQVLGGKYRLVRQLGVGGMGSVWYAEHLTLGSPVALKLIDPAIAKEPDAVQRFLREARTAAHLRSPHVVQILDYGVDGETPYIAMELLEGESLAERLARQGRLGTRETARTIQHIARAIGRAHDAGIVHRDLKPENVFIVKNDDEELVKVLDFGIVKTTRGSLAESGLATTRTGTVLGTPYFMSPEQAEGIKAVDHRTDIWALGVIAYRCLVGTLPFNGDVVGRLILEICSRPLPVPSHSASVPEGFDAWFARACARDPNARFSSAKQAAAAFSQLSEGQLTPGSIDPRPSAGSAEPRLGVTTGHSTNSEMESRPNRVERARRSMLFALAAAVLVAGALLARKLTVRADAPVPAAAPVAAHPGLPEHALTPAQAAVAWPSETARDHAEQAARPPSSVAPGDSAAPPTPASASSALRPAESAAGRSLQIPADRSDAPARPASKPTPVRKPKPRPADGSRQPQPVDLGI